MSTSKISGTLTFSALDTESAQIVDIAIKVNLSERNTQAAGADPGALPRFDGDASGVVTLLRDAATRLERSLQAREYPLPQDEISVTVRPLPGETQQIKIQVTPADESTPAEPVG